MKNTIHWTKASTPPVADNPKSTIVLCVLTVEFPDDPFKPGHPFRSVIDGCWWSLTEKQWYLNGVTRDDLRVIAWTDSIDAYEGPE